MQDLKDFVDCEFVNDRIDFQLNDRSEIDIVFEKLSNIDSAIGLPVTGKDTKDGIKIYFGDSSWVLARPSGTEPLLRIYFESNNKENIKNLEDEILAKIK